MPQRHIRRETTARVGRDTGSASERRPRARGQLRRVLVTVTTCGCWPLLVSPGSLSAQQPARATPLVFDQVTVVDVEHGRLVPHQRVVVSGTRIQAVGDVRAVPLPPGAQRVAARGKYLIPGLWDMHVHTALNFRDFNAIYAAYLLNGVTGVREAGCTRAPRDTVRQWRRDIAAGTRVGPRILLAGMVFSGEFSEAELKAWKESFCSDPPRGVTTPAEARRVVEDYKAAGVDFIKLRGVDAKDYFAIAAAARQAGIPFGGHLEDGVTALEASDSGASIIDHIDATGMLKLCAPPRGSIEQCQPIAEHFRRNGTWWVPTLITYGIEKSDGTPDPSGWLRIAQRVGLPIMAGTDEIFPNLRYELATYVAEGLTPLEALQSATLNPAKYLHATDSMGTIAPGKLADLVLLDADPLANITNTTKIHSVVANGRYFGPAGLNQLKAAYRAWKEADAAKARAQEKADSIEVAPHVARFVGDSIVLPAVVVATPHDHTVELPLANLGEDSVQVDVTVQDAAPAAARPGENHTSQAAAPKPAPGNASGHEPRSLAGWLQDVPASLTLMPKEKRTLILHLALPSLLRAGQYSAHLILWVTPVGYKFTKDKGVPDSRGTNLHFIVGVGRGQGEADVPIPKNAVRQRVVKIVFRAP